MGLLLLIAAVSLGKNGPSSSGYQFAVDSSGTGGPEKSAEIHKGTATLYFFVTRPESSTPPRPVSINLIDKGGEWSLADDQLLSQVVERVNRAKPPAS